MSKYIKLPYHDSSTHSVATFMQVLDKPPGIHKIDTGYYLVTNSRGYFYIGVDSTLQPIEDLELVANTSFTGGISEDTLLAALAITQNPTLATTILAMRQPGKN